MAVQVSYPGVYIEEFTPGAPIQGVGTSTAAFLGPARSGPLMRPVQLTSWDAFQATFGGDLDGYYLWYAVRGFFQNGGQVCYVVRISNAAAARAELKDRSAGHKTTLVITALEPGVGGNGITYTVGETKAITTGEVFKWEAAITGVAGTQLAFGSADDVTRFGRATS